MEQYHLKQENRRLTALTQSQNEELKGLNASLEQKVAERTAELRDANAQLAEASHLVRTVADNIPGRVAYWGPDLRCRFANRSFIDWFELTGTDVIGRNAADISSPSRAVKVTSASCWVSGLAPSRFVMP